MNPPSANAMLQNNDWNSMSLEEVGTNAGDFLGGMTAGIMFSNLMNLETDAQ